MDPLEQQAKQQQENSHNQQRAYEISQDIIRVYNPLEANVNAGNLRATGWEIVNGDFFYKVDGYPNVIKSRQSKDVERYKMRLFFHRFCDYTIGELQRITGEKMLKERKDRGEHDYLDKYFENKEIWDKTPKQDDEQLIGKIAKQVVLGLVSEYGTDVPQRVAPLAQPVAGDMRSLYDQVLDITTKQLADDDIPEPTAEPVKKKLAMEVLDDTP